MSEVRPRSLIKEGSDSWNKWRADCSVSHVDLRGMDLREVDLKGMNLNGVNLFRADLRETNLRGANLSNARLLHARLSLSDLSEARLDSANLTDADLSGTNLYKTQMSHGNLTRANLDGARLCETRLNYSILHRANLTRALFVKTELSATDLSFVDLSGAHFHDVDLRLMSFLGANLSGADFRNANLHGAKFPKANCRYADFRQASLIDSVFEEVDLTGAKLWEAQTSGWSLRGVRCEWACLDREGVKRTTYNLGDFEKVFGTTPIVILRYPGGMEPVELSMLPLAIDAMQQLHPNCLLSVHSIIDDGTGASVAITVRNKTSQPQEEFELSLQKIKQECLKLTGQRDTLRDLLKDAWDRLQQVARPIVIERMLVEGTLMTGDNYNVYGQAAAVGREAQAHHTTLQQVSATALDLPRLLQELTQLRGALEHQASGEDEQKVSIAAVNSAVIAAENGNSSDAVGHLKMAGKWALNVAQEIGVPIATEALKQALGLP